MSVWYIRVYVRVCVCVCLSLILHSLPPFLSYLPSSSSSDHLEGATSASLGDSSASPSSHPLTAFTMPLAFFGVDPETLSSPLQPHSPPSPSHLSLLAGSRIEKAGWSDFVGYCRCCCCCCCFTQTFWKMTRSVLTARSEELQQTSSQGGGSGGGRCRGG